VKNGERGKVRCESCKFKGEQMGFFDPVELYCKRTETRVDPGGSCFKGEPIEKFR